MKEKVAEQLLGVKALLREEFDSQLSYDVMFKVILFVLTYIYI